MAVERTQLAWWRTGLTALAVAIGVGRVVPEIGDVQHRWPYAVLGVGFAAYAVAVMWIGGYRGAEAARRVAAGEPMDELGRLNLALTLGGAALAVATAALIVAN